MRTDTRHGQQTADRHTEADTRCKQKDLRTRICLGEEKKMETSMRLVPMSDRDDPRRVSRAVSLGPCSCAGWLPRGHDKTIITTDSAVQMQKRPDRG